MNRLRGTNKRAEEKLKVQISPNSDSSFPLKVLKRSKRLNEEPEPEVETNAPLLSAFTDVFRTRIVMAELSARFSLLRESPTTNSPQASDIPKIRVDSTVYTGKGFQRA